MGLPSFLAFRPDPDTVQASLQVQGMLQHLEKLVTAQHVVAQRLGQDGVLPAIVALYDWSIRSQRDILGYAANLAEYLRDGQQPSVELAISADLAADLTRVLTQARELLDKVATKLPAEDQDLAEAAVALSPQLGDAVEAVADATYDGEEDVEEDVEGEGEEGTEGEDEDSLVDDADEDALVDEEA